MKIPAQPSSAISFQAPSSYLPDSASSRTRSGLKRALSSSLAVRLIACWSSVKSKFIPLPQLRQAEHALGDDVLEDLGRAALDRVGARAQQAVGPGRVPGRPVLAEDVHGELCQRLVQVAPLPLRQRALWAGHAVLHDRREAAPGVEPQELHLDRDLSEALADDGVVGRPALAGELLEVLERHPHPRGRRGPETGALVHQRGDRHGPAVADPADHVLVGDPRLLDEELVELGLVRDLVERAHLHRVLLHVHDEVGQALVLRRVLVGPRDEHAPLRLVGERGPDLLPRHDPLAVRLHCPGLQRGEVGARVGLGEALAPDLVAGEYRVEPALLLLIGAVVDDHRAAHDEAEHVRGLRRSRTGHLLAEQRLLDERRAPASVFRGPGEPRVAGVVELPLPPAAVVEGGVLAWRVLARVVVSQPGAQLVAERLFRGRQRQVHGGVMYLRPLTGALPRPRTAFALAALRARLAALAARGLLLSRVAAAAAAAALLALAAPTALPAPAGRAGRIRDRRRARLAHALLAKALVLLVVLDARTVVLCHVITSALRVPRAGPGHA